MNKLQKLINKVVKRNGVEEVWYKATMITPGGTEYYSSVKASSYEEAEEKILNDSFKGNKIINIRKESN